VKREVAGKKSSLRQGEKNVYFFSCTVQVNEIAEEAQNAKNPNKMKTQDRFDHVLVVNVADVLGAGVNDSRAVASPPCVVFRRVIGGEAGEVGLRSP
jgi:hypothetical protein